LIAIPFIVVFVSVVIFTFTQQEVYESQVRLIVDPSSVVSTDIRELREAVIDLDRPIVVNTYAEIAQSPAVFETSWSQLNMEQDPAYEVKTSVLQETSIMEITVSGPNPILAQQLAIQVTNQTFSFIEELDTIYELTLLDEASLDFKPVTPNKPLNISLGIIIGLGIGVVFAFAGEYLEAPLQYQEDGRLFPWQLKNINVIRWLGGDDESNQKQSPPLSMGVIRIDNYTESLESLPKRSSRLIIEHITSAFDDILPKESLLIHWSIASWILLIPSSNNNNISKIFDDLAIGLSAIDSYDNSGSSLVFDGKIKTENTKNINLYIQIQTKGKQPK
jgi:capsular polysaccharide biosynthesis protein